MGLASQHIQSAMELIIWRVVGVILSVNSPKKSAVWLEMLLALDRIMVEIRVVQVIH